jgi:hypothetical protein
MTTILQTFLSEDEVLFNRMQTLHRQRVDAIASGQSHIGKRESGVLVVHLIPLSSVRTRTHIDIAKLKEHGRMVPALGSDGAQSRFNADGVLRGYEEGGPYSQLFRDGRLEAAMPEIAFPIDRQQNGSPVCLRDSICEHAMFTTIGGYLRFCTAVGLGPPIQMFSAIVGCEGVRICTDWGFRDLSNFAIDRSPVFLPDLEIDSLDANPMKLLRPWCDTLWQASGIERSFNFDEQGNWRERRR